MTGANAFGSGSVNDGPIKCSVYFLPEGSQKVPNLSSMTPAGFLFAKTLNIAARAFEDGFPGLDPAGSKRTKDFALRCEWALQVAADTTFDFSVIADDGAILYIDDTVIVDNDGAHVATEKHGPARILPGTHYARVDYYQGATPNVALQVLVTAPKSTPAPLGGNI